MEAYAAQNGGVLPDDFPRPHLNNIDKGKWVNGDRDF